MGIKRVVAVDFGTSTTVVKWKDYNQNRPRDSVDATYHVEFDGRRICPSIARIDQAGKHIYGFKAESGAGELISNLKMFLPGGAAEELSSGEQARMTEIVKGFFRYLCEQYREQSRNAGAAEEECTYLSFPAKFNDRYKALLQEMAGEAGFLNVECIDEPSAALHAVLVQKTEELQRRRLVSEGRTCTFMLIDMGAGTTDFVIARHELKPGGRTTIIATWPTIDNPTLFGGREVDEILYQHCTAHIEQYTGKSEENPGRKNNLLRQVKQWKDSTLSDALEQDIAAAEPAFITNMASFMDLPELPPLDRKGFWPLCGDYFKQLPRMINDCLAETEAIKKGFSRDHIEFVILTGGHSQWYFLPELLQGKRLFDDPDIETADLPCLDSPHRVIRMDLPSEPVANGMLFIPLHPNFKKVATNNLWVQFHFDGASSKLIHVMQIGEILPVVHRPYETEFKIKAHGMKFKFNGTCNVFVGKELKTAKRYNNYVASTRDKVEQVLSVAFAPIVMLIGKTDETVRIQLYVDIDDKQTLKLSGGIGVGIENGDKQPFTIRLQHE